MKILLINPVIRASEYPPIRFPLGLAYIASVLQNEGHDVKVLDINANRWGKDELSNILRKADFDIAGLTGLVTEYKEIRWLADTLKEVHPKKPIVLGGPLGTTFPEIILKNTKVDVVVISEGIETAKELMHAFKKRTKLNDVKGLYYRSVSGAIAFTGHRPFIKNVDEIPLPARDLFPFKTYISPSNLRIFDKNIKSTEVITSYGCPYRCTYCFHEMWGHMFRARSPESVVQEIKLLHDKYGINGIFFSDDEFVLDRKRVMEICDLIRKEKLDISWVTSGRVNLMTKELLTAMRSAGCRVITYGIESGSQKILNEIGKGVTVQQARQAMKDTWDAGILPHGFLIIGLFGETPETIRETVKFCNETGLIGQFSFATPFPGTELYEEARKRGKLTQSEGWLLEHWGEYNDRLLVNLTNMSDEKLMRLKRQAERDILFGNLPQKMWKHMKIVKMKNIVGEGIFLAKRWYSKKYTNAITA